MKIKNLKINFRYLGGNIACLSVDNIDGKSIHNDVNNEEAIIIFNSLIGEKENCKTIKSLLKENQEFKKQLEEYKNRYINRLNNQLAEGVEPDPEDYYLAEIEGKANDYDKLLKQLEERNIEYFKGAYDTHNKYYDQQQKFIKYLEDEIERKRKNATCMFEYNHTVLPLKEVLQKYEEIMNGTEQN